MSASERNTETLAQIAAGDVVSPQEAAKSLTTTLVALIDQPFDSGRTRDDLANEMLARWDAPCRELLAVLFPLVEYGEERALAVLSRCMRHIADATAAVNRDGGWNRQCGVLVLGQLIWGLTAFSLHCRQLNGLAELARVSVHTPNRGHRVEPLVTLQELRYPNALGGNAQNAYDHYHDWLLAIDFIPERYELFAGDLKESYDEADLVLAIRAALDTDHVYCIAKDTNTTRRFADHALDPRCRPALARTFRTSEDELNETLERAFSQVATDQHRWDRPASLFGNEN